MRYFLHVITDKERIIDPDGMTFYDLATAEAEASQSARDLMAEELRCGRPLPLGWRLQIADENEAVVLTLTFSSLVFGASQQPMAQPQKAAADRMLVERARSTFARVRKSHSEINDGLVRLKNQVRALAQFNAAIRSSPADGSA